MGMHAGRPPGPMTRLTNSPLRVPTNDDLAWGDGDDRHVFALPGDHLDVHAQRWLDAVLDASSQEVCVHSTAMLGRRPDDGAVVVDSDEDPASHAVGHADDGLVEVVLPQPTFELDVQGLARSEEGSKVHPISIHSYEEVNQRSRTLAITLSIFGARNAPVAPLVPPFTPPGAAAPRAGSG